MYSQTWIGGNLIKVDYKLHELSICDDQFLHDLDSLIFRSGCPNLRNKSYKYFSVSLTESEDSRKLINFRMELLRLPVGCEDDLGYFMHNGYTFLVNGVNPNKLFATKKDMQAFSFERYDFCVVEEYPRWIFEYKQCRLFLIERSCW